MNVMNELIKNNACLWYGHINSGKGMWKDEEKSFIKKIIFPGVDKTQIAVKCTNDVLIVVTKVTSEYYPEGYEIHLAYPEYSDVKKLKVTLSNGVLIFDLPKKNKNLNFEVN